MLFSIVIIIIFFIGLSLLGLGIYLGFKRVKNETGLLNRLNALLRIIFDFQLNPFSLISIGFLLGGLLTLASTFFILNMFGYIKME